MTSNSSKQQHQTAAALAKLTENIQIKRLNLNKLYDDLNLKNPTNSTTNLIKHVKFDETDDEDDKQLNNTNTNKISRPLHSKENHNKPAKANQKSPVKSPIKTPIKRQQTATMTAAVVVAPQINRLKINTKTTILKTNPNKIQLEFLRRKIILRKFGYIWLRKHFYSQNKTQRIKYLLPSQLIKYHEKRLISNVFREWNKESRFTRNEWRLTVKAQCHHNYTILNKYWFTWQEYAHEHKEDTLLQNKAINHSNLKLKRLYFTQFRLFRMAQLRKRNRLDQINNQLGTYLIKQTFEKWRLKYRKQNELNCLDDKANDHFEMMQRTKVFLFWYFKFKNEKEDRRLERIAARNYKLNLFKKCFQSLKYYCMYRKRKKIQKLKLKEYAESQLVFKVYKTWQHKYEMKQKLNDLNEQISIFQIKNQMIRVFNLWKTSYSNRILLKDKMKRMNKYYEKKLKAKIFQALFHNYQIAFNERNDLLRAEKFSIYWQKKIYFSVWTDRLEDKNEIKMMHLVYKAKRHFEYKIFNKYILNWKIFRLQQLKLKAKIEKANLFYDSKLKEKYFPMIGLYVQITKEKKENYFKAEEVFKYNQLSKFYSLWAKNYEISIEYQMNNRIAILHYESSFKQNIFTKWFLKFQLQLKDENNKDKSAVHYNKLVLKRTFFLWLNHLKTIKKEIQNENKAVHHDFKRLCLPCIKSWKSYLNESKVLNEKCFKANEYFEKKLLHRLITVWRLQTKVFKNQNQLIELKFKSKQHEHKFDLFQRWYHFTQLCKHEKENEKLADTFYLKHFMLRIINKWNAYAEYRLHKRSVMNQSIINVNKIKIKLIFSKWKQKAREHMNEQTKCKLADQFYLKNIQKCVFIQWKLKYIPQSRIIKYKLKQSDLFLEMRLKTEFYFKWFLKYEQEKKLKDKNMKALLFWSINVQKTHLAALIKWFRLNQAKKNRYKLALEMRNKSILKECARRFIQYSTDSKERRINANKLLTEKQSLYCLDLANKYFHVWLNKCDFHKQKTVLVQNKMPISIDTSPSLNKREEISIQNNYCSPTQRPAPRKPAFLLNDSVDIAEENKQLTSPIFQTTARSTIEPIVLMPPTAFVPTSTKKTTILMPSQSLKSTFNEEPNIELIQFKKILENYSNKSEKLKRLREQERLLNNCSINENNINQSICETISTEKEEISKEIKELVQFLKNERFQITNLAKKFNL